MKRRVVGTILFVSGLIGLFVEGPGADLWLQFLAGLCAFVVVSVGIALLGSAPRDEEG
jgi:hypothetical protein